MDCRYRIAIARKYFICTLLIISPYFITAQENESSNTSKEKTFSVNPDDLGALENSVNLFTGQVTFPMNLVSLPGGLNISVAMQYNSAGVPAMAETWNAEAPTGILGLGWSMDIPKIVVDHKQTGTRYDDRFYVVEGGTS